MHIVHRYNCWLCFWFSVYMLFLLLLLLLLSLSFINIQLHHTIQNFEQKFIGPFLLSEVKLHLFIQVFNRLMSDDQYRGRAAPLTSKRCILYIYSTNIGTEYFKTSIYSFCSGKAVIWGSVCIFSYPTCKVRAPYCHLWAAWLCKMFPHYLINDMIFNNKKSYGLWNLCFDFWYILSWKHFSF